MEKLSKFGKFERAGVIFQVCAHEMFYFLAQNVSFDPLKLLVIDRACEYAFATKEGKFYEIRDVESHVLSRAQNEKKRKKEIPCLPHLITSQICF